MSLLSRLNYDTIVYEAFSKITNFLAKIENNFYKKGRGRSNLYTIYRWTSGWGFVCKNWSSNDTVNAKDYSEEQLNVWATGNIDLTEWNKSLSEHYTVVAVENNIIVGFGDIDKTGYLDRLYVHKDYQRRGIATAICNELEKEVKTSKVITHSSITAKHFFMQRGFNIVKKQLVIRNGIALTNYIMEKQVR